MSDLDLTRLPDLPQSAAIARFAPRLWDDARAVALWLGGSLARGAGDPYSDIDLRLAVRPNDLDAWRTPDLEALFAGAVLGSHHVRFGADALLHHLALASGDILDFLVQSTAHPLAAEPVLVLGCRDGAFARLLDTASHAPEPPARPASAETVRQLIVDFWINSHKHRKVLHRGLDLMLPSGLHVERMLLLRLWYILATDDDPTEDQLRGIHGLSAFVRAIQAAQGPAALALVGVPLRTRAEITDAIERHRAAASQAGHAVAVRYGFTYPDALERMVRRAWEEFMRLSLQGI